MSALTDSNAVIARIAGAIAEPARARMLYCLLDRRARTSTELALVVNVNASTASAHLSKLKAARLVTLVAQGKHRFYSLNGREVAAVLERLAVLAGVTTASFIPSAPEQLRGARTCYDHIAGTLGVSLHDQFVAQRWLVRSKGIDDAYDVTNTGEISFHRMGVDVNDARATRRRFAYACLDWSERRPHLAGALAAALLSALRARKWVMPAGDSRALRITPLGERELRRHVQLVIAG